MSCCAVTVVLSYAVAGRRPVIEPDSKDLLPSLHPIFTDFPPNQTDRGDAS